MRFVWIMVGIVGGAAIGVAFGFCGALVAASFSAAPDDGTYGMREMLIALPLGLGLGGLAGAIWGLRRGR